KYLKNFDHINIESSAIAKSLLLKKTNTNVDCVRSHVLRLFKVKIVLPPYSNAVLQFKNIEGQTKYLKNFDHINIESSAIAKSLLLKKTNTNVDCVRSHVLRLFKVKIVLPPYSNAVLQFKNIEGQTKYLKNFDHINIESSAIAKSLLLKKTNTNVDCVRSHVLRLFKVKIVLPPYSNAVLQFKNIEGQTKYLKNFDHINIESSAIAKSLLLKKTNTNVDCVRSHVLRLFKVKIVLPPYSNAVLQFKNIE
ncbi:Hypothetical protein CINCED_3A019717, partial [Cinara cedri]